MLHAALGSARSVINVGAGTGSYEPTDRLVTAVEPSALMISQRSAQAAPVVQASADHLPFKDKSFDAAMAILTIHHWQNRERAFSELRRVARQKVVILTWDPTYNSFWLVRDYFPEIFAVDEQIFPTIGELVKTFPSATVTDLPIPFNCTDGFLGAYWRRPESYLDNGVRGAISSFRHVTQLEKGLTQLAADLQSGKWEQQNGHLRSLDHLCLGYRLVTAEV
ncbi:MAG: class I SAM-dependent methyltransferase [Polyangiaceae bacterium]|nr:class I SAM-dependent methyltransferase [Polyangiaceae bacterium]